MTESDPANHPADPLARVLPDPAPPGAYTVPGTAVHAVRWLHTPGMVGAINLCLVRHVAYAIDEATGEMSCRVVMAYLDETGRPEEYRLHGATAKALYDLQSREMVWLAGRHP